MSGLYIHVPFCQKRCFYCSFYSTTFGKKERDFYTKALINEMTVRSKEYPRLLSTIYFGGGTPSQLDIEELNAIFSSIHGNFEIDKNAEITFEVNPDDVTEELAENLKLLGVNRISMGVQSFQDELLKSINRRHTSSQALDSINCFINAGITNISIDLIYGLPHQTDELWKSDLELAFSLPIQHLSSYALSIEEGTPLYYMRARKEISEIDDETFLRRYEMLIDAAEKAGFVHYEISNFSRKGFQSRHNSSYWSGEPYLGLGPGAHSYDGKNIRTWNHPNLNSYISYWNDHDGSSCFSFEELNDSELYDEIIMTRLRTGEGLLLSELKENEQEYFLSQVKKHIRLGNIIQIDENYRLSRKGLFISDDIMSDLMWEL